VRLADDLAGGHCPERDRQHPADDGQQHVAGGRERRSRTASSTTSTANVE
jgi:hypothetical protein